MRKIKSFILYELKLFQMFYIKLEEMDMSFLSSNVSCFRQWQICFEIDALLRPGF